ncbi:ATP-grasp domain-containing protein [Haliea sp. E17]|uniref:carboxylate--amine ligase n=1 Tax=Haliea sp. E17 TaxID=3401576 RepID=UPI003AAF09D9
MSTATAFVMTHESNATRTANDKAHSLIALAITRSLGRRGVRVVRLHPNALDTSLCSKYVSAVEICPNQYSSEEDLLNFLTELVQKYEGEKVLIPASDDCSMFIADHYEALSAHFRLVNPDSQSMKRMRDKLKQYRLAESAGVPIPETYCPESLEEVESLAGKLKNFPYAIKPLVAQKWRLQEYGSVSKNKKAFTVNSPEELVREYTRIAEADGQLMIQEIIGGDDTNLLTVIGYCGADSDLMAYCVRSKLRQHPIDFGYCTSTVSCHHDIVERQARQLMQRANYNGIVGIEFKYDKKSDQHKLIEINTRPVNTTGISSGCGVDLPYIAYCDVLDIPGPKFNDWEDGVVWLRLKQDFVAARELKKLGKIGYIEWLRSIRGKRVHATFAMDDLRPFLQHYSQYAINKFRGLPT